mgnify:CR=1 FL=1
MMKNKKGGFTLVELLAVIVILGVLSTIGVVSVNKYLTQSRKKSYKIMSQTIYEATMNCITQGKCAAPTRSEAVVVSTDTLIKYGYLKKLDNPYSKRSDCVGSVVVKNKSNDNNSEYQKYTYDVQLTCDGVADNTLIWPEEKKNQTSLSNIKISSEKTNSNANSSATDDEKIICKRSLTLHTEKCETDLCSTRHELGSSIVYGNIAEYGKLKSGDAFDCDVNGDGVYDSASERFYYVTDLDNDTAVLIFYANTNGSVVGNGDSFGTRYGKGTYGPYSGPNVAIEYLPNVSQWNNIELKNKIRAITTPSNNSYSMMRNDKINLPTKFNYSGYAARLITYQEILQACPNSIVAQYANDLELKNCEYLMENTGYSLSGQMRWYWIENPTDSCYRDCGAMLVDSLRYAVSSANSAYTVGVRPVIEVQKKNIGY